MSDNSTKSLEEGIVSAIKAIGRDNAIDADFCLEQIDFNLLNQDYFSSSLIKLPKLNNVSPNRLRLVRAVADLGAFYNGFFDAKIYHQNVPDGRTADIFDNLEKFRLIVEGSKNFKGAGINLVKLIEDNLENLDPETGFLPLFLFKNNDLKSEKISRFLEIYRKFLSKEIKEKLLELQNLTSNQKEFSQKSLELIDLFKNEQNSKKNEKAKSKQEKPEDKIEETKADGTLINEENIEASSEISNQMENKFAENDQNQEGKNPAFLGEDFAKAGLEAETLDSTSKEEKIKFIADYKIFTNKFDQIIKAEGLTTSAELQNLREQLDLKLEKLSTISNRLTAKLKRQLLAKKEVTWEQNKEEGVVDRKKINQIISNPFKGNYYATIKEHNYQDTLVCLLLDNSGSMRGAPITVTAMASEIIARILEKFGIKTEILGFTTVDWRGGKSRKLWESSGKPANPGRLSDLRHIIYKTADQSFKKSRQNLALMLKEGILKENIDGEALIWAKKRLDLRNEQRKILMVISDGTPVDDSTNSNNSNHFLSDHLHHVISKIEKHSNIELTAIGIGHEVGDYYKNSVTIANSDELGDVMIERICRLI